VPRTWLHIESVRSGFYSLLYFHKGMEFGCGCLTLVPLKGNAHQDETKLPGWRMAVAVTIRWNLLVYATAWMWFWPGVGLPCRKRLTKYCENTC